MKTHVLFGILLVVTSLLLGLALTQTSDETVTTNANTEAVLISAEELIVPTEEILVNEKLNVEGVKENQEILYTSEERTLLSGLYKLEGRLEQIQSAVDEAKRTTIEATETAKNNEIILIEKYKEMVITKAQIPIVNALVECAKDSASCLTALEAIPNE